MISHAGFLEIIDKMPNYLLELEECEAIGLDSRAERRALRKKLPGRGIYVLYESGKPMYVGRSDNLPSRLLQHSERSGDSYGATFAFRITKGEFPASKGLPNKDLQMDAEFRRRFQENRERVRKMLVRAVKVEDSIEQAVLEVYVHRRFGTQFNSFENH